MEKDLNITYLVLGGHVEVHKYKYIYFTIAFIVYIFIICSNSTIVYLIWKHQDLHEPMYIFIAALLMNSVLFSTNIYPKLLIDFLSDKQIISYKACIVQYFMFYSLGGSSFYLLAAMSYDRYVSICKPLYYPTIMRKTTVIIFLVLSWILPACQLVGLATIVSNQQLCRFTLEVIFCNNTIYKLHCVSSRLISIYGLIILLNIVVFPVFFIIFTYARLLMICYRSCAQVQKKAAKTCLPHLLALINVSFFSAYDVITVRTESNFPKTANLIITLQLVLYNSLLNPIIYGLKMQNISKHLKRFCFVRIN